MNDNKQTTRNKIVIRDIPISVTKDAFNALLSPWAPSITFSSFRAGKEERRPLSIKEKQGGFAHVAFNDSECLLEFCREFGHKFNISLAINQKIPKPSAGHYSSSAEEDEASRPSSDALSKHPKFLQFLKDQSATTSSPETINKMSLEDQLDAMLVQEKELNPWKFDAGKLKSTPLLEYLKASDAFRDDKYLVLGSKKYTQQNASNAKPKKKKKKKKNGKDHPPQTQSANPQKGNKKNAPIRLLSRTQNNEDSPKHSDLANNKSLHPSPHNNATTSSNNQKKMPPRKYNTKSKNIEN